MRRDITADDVMAACQIITTLRPIYMDVSVGDGDDGKILETLSKACMLLDCWFDQFGFEDQT